MRKLVLSVVTGLSKKITPPSSRLLSSNPIKMKNYAIISAGGRGGMFLIDKITKPLPEKAEYLFALMLHNSLLQSKKFQAEDVKVLFGNGAEVDAQNKAFIHTLIHPSILIRVIAKITGTPGDEIHQDALVSQVLPNNHPNFKRELKHCLSVSKAEDTIYIVLTGHENAY